MNHSNLTVPFVTFKTRVRDESVGGPNPYRWQEMTTNDYFSGKRVLVFSLPGAFTPTCSTMQVPGFENNYDLIRNYGIDEIYCVSVNDAFVMNAWAKAQNVENIKMIPDGSGTFTRQMGMLVAKDNLGFGMRSWRYAMIVDDSVIEKIFIEPGLQDNCETDPYGETSPETIMKYLESAKAIDLSKNPTVSFATNTK
jgi:peroxiredoxin